MKYFWVVLLLFSGVSILAPQNISVPFDSVGWDLTEAEVVEHAGRMCVMGTALLRDVVFENGVIEVDMLVTASRAYPGIMFRRQSPVEFEEFYIRPHRSIYYPDALQYTPRINGLACWQLYNGEGYTASAEIPTNEWIPVRIEVKGRRAQVFFRDLTRPAIRIEDLKLGTSKGSVAVYGTRNRTAFFSNFRYRLDDDLPFPAPTFQDTPPGLLTAWEVSETFDATTIDLEHAPSAEELSRMRWERIAPEPSGLFNLGRRIPTTLVGPPLVYARTIINAGEPKTLKLQFGYSDIVTVFCNGARVFQGNSSYQSRDRSFLGAVGLHDAAYLTLQKGKNVILLSLVENNGGWGFICQDGDAVHQEAGLTKLWETGRVFRTPETVVFDPRRGVLYVSNYDPYVQPTGRHFLSRVGLDGAVLDREWVAGLNTPIGMTIHGDTLYVSERTSLTLIDIPRAVILGRFSMPGAVVLNDLAAGAEGTVYLTDSFRNAIVTFKDGVFTDWLKGPDIRQPNGLHLLGETLLFGNSGDNSVKAAGLRDGDIRTIARLNQGTIDGIEEDEQGNLLVSHWEGRLFRITPDGDVTKILDTTAPGVKCANFAYVPSRRMLVAPTFFGNTLAAYAFQTQ